MKRGGYLIADTFDRDVAKRPSKADDDLNDDRAVWHGAVILWQDVFRFIWLGLVRVSNTA